MTGSIATAFDWAIRATWQASCLAALVLLVQWLCGRRLSARARCWLWAIVIARLLLPPLPAVRWTLLHARTTPPSNNSVERPHFAGVTPTLPAITQPNPAPSPILLAHDRPASKLAINPALVAELRTELATMRAAEAKAPPAPAAALIRPVAPAPISPSKAPPRPPLWPRVVAAAAWLWLAGVGAFLLRIIVVSAGLARTVRRLPTLESTAPAALLADCARQIGVTRVPELRLADDLPGPALAGWLRPKLLVPRSVLSAFAEADLRLMFLHELAHVRRRDVAVNWLVSLVTSLHWFNPTVWLAARRLRADRELACDELVIATNAQAGGGPAYGHTLLRLADWLSARPAVPRALPAMAGVVEILEDARELQRRIVMIARFNPKMARWPALLAGGGLLVAGLALTDAAEPAAATRPAITAQPAAARDTAAAGAQSDDAKLLDEKLDARRAELDERDSRQKLLQQQFEAGVQGVTQPQVVVAAAEVAEARQAVTDAQIALATIRAPSEVSRLLRQRQAEAEEDVRLREKAVELLKKQQEAGLLPDPDAVRVAEILTAKARAALADAKIAVERSPYRVSAAGPGLPPPSASSNDLVAAVQDADAERVDEDAARKLAKPIQIAFRAGDKPRPLSEWSQDLAKALGLNVIVQSRALEEVGIADDSPVKLTLQAPAPAGQVLTWALRDLGGSAVRLGYTIDHGAVVISTADNLAHLTVTRVYDVADLVGQPGDANLAAVIVNVVDPGSWRDNGSSIGTVMQFRDKLIVTQSQENHADVARLLTLLRAKAGAADAFAPRAAPREQGEAPPQVPPEELYGPNHPAVAGPRNALKVQSAEHIRQVLMAVKIFDRQNGHLPDGLDDNGLGVLLTVAIPANPRLAYLQKGYDWISPDVKRLADIKDPARTPLMREAVAQPDGSALVGYADGHVVELKADELKAMDAAVRASARVPMAEIRIGEKETMQVPQPIAAECQSIADEYDRQRARDANGNVTNEALVHLQIKRAIEAKVESWERSEAKPSAREN